MDVLTATFRSGDVMRWRSVSAMVRSAVLEVPVPPARLVADWRREIFSQLGLEPGDIEALPLARTRLRWREFPGCVDAAERWMQTLGLPDVLQSSEMALMGSRGTGYHHDGAHYGGAAFCNVFLSEDGGTEMHFPAAGHRIALARGTAVIFDPCQPHAIIKRGAPGFDEADFSPEQDRAQVFLTWELPIERVDVMRALGVTFDMVGAGTLPALPQQVWREGAPARLCPRTGAWLS